MNMYLKMHAGKIYETFLNMLFLGFFFDWQDKFVHLLVSRQTPPFMLFSQDKLSQFVAMCTSIDKKI